MESTRTEVPVAFGLTDPIVRVDSGYKRMYEIPVGDNIFSAPSVTSITDATLRSIGVEKWKESLITKKLYSMTGNVLGPDDVNEVMSAPDREFKESGEIGTQLHEIIHGLINETDVRIPDQLLPSVKGFMKWRESYMKDWTLAGSEVGVHWIEPYLGQDGAAFGYAGTVDAIWKNGSRILVCDWKTSSGIYPSHMMQVAAYAHALQNMLSAKELSEPEFFVNGTKHKVPFKVEALVVLFDNHKDSNRQKVFTEKIKLYDVDVGYWYDAFKSCYDLSQYTKKKITATRYEGGAKRW